MLRILWGLILLTCSLSACADSLGMYDVDKGAVVHTYIDLQTKGQGWYIFHNDSLQTIWLNSVIKNPAASAGWGSKLEAQKYSLLTLDSKKLIFTCSIQEGSEFKIVPCKHYMHVSEVLSSTANNTARAGSFWVVEDVPLKDLKSLAAKRDILVNY